MITLYYFDINDWECKFSFSNLVNSAWRMETILCFSIMILMTCNAWKTECIVNVYNSYQEQKFWDIEK